MRMTLNLGAVLLASMSLVSCGKTEEPVSTVKSKGFSCDLQSSGAASNDASKRAFQCAYNSLKSAGKLAAGGLVKDIANIIEGSKSVYDASNAAFDVFSDINEFVRNGGREPIDLQDSSKNLGKTLDSGKAAFEKTEVGERLKRKAMYRCLDGNYRAVKDLVSLVNLTSSLGSGSQRSSTLTFSELQSLGTVGYSGVKAILDRMSTLSECTQWLSGSRSKSLVQLSNGVKRIATSLEVVTTVARCGVDLAYGGYVLYSNSACLVEDLKNLSESRDRLDKQRENFIDSGINPEADTSLANRACMQKYGIYLYKTGPGEIYNSRAYMCAMYCGNKGRRTQFVQDNFYSIVRNESDRSTCRGLTNTVLDSESVNACMVFCCDQDGVCRDSAWEKLRYYKL